MHFGHSTGRERLRIDVHRSARQACRKAELAGNLVMQCLPIAGIESLDRRDPRHHGDSRIACQSLGDILIHAYGTAQHAAADIGDIRQFQQSLDGAILAQRTMHDGEDDIDSGLGGQWLAAIERRQGGPRLANAQIKPQHLTNQFDAHTSFHAVATRAA